MADEAWRDAWLRDREEVRAAGDVREAYRRGFEAGVRATGQAADRAADALLNLIGTTRARPKGQG